MQRHRLRGQVSAAFLIGLGICVAGMFAADINAHSDTATQNRPRIATSAENQFQRLGPSYAETVKQLPSATPTPPGPFRPESCVGGWGSTIVLPDRNEVVAGGCDHGNPISSISFTDPLTGRSRHAGNLLVPRADQGALLLKSRWIYFIGGMGPWKRPIKEVEVFDLLNGNERLAGEIKQGRCAPSIAELPDSHILIAGGRACDPYPPARPLRTLELYDPHAETSRVVAQFSEDRMDPTLTSLADGRILFTGGVDARNQPVTRVEIFDPKTNVLGTVGSMLQCEESIVPLVDGDVLFAGGVPCGDVSGPALRSADIFNLSTSRFEKTGDMIRARRAPGVITLRNGKVLFAGGSPGYEGFSEDSAEIYDPRDGKFMATGNMTGRRTSPLMTLRPDSTVLVSDGSGETPSVSFTLRSSEIYNPSSGEFTPVSEAAKSTSKSAVAPP